MKKKAAEPEAVPVPPELTFAGLMAHVIDAGIMFQFAYLPREESERRYAAKVGQADVSAPTAVGALLTALAKNVLIETARAAKHTEELAARRASLAKITTALPGLEAHAPPKDGVCDNCGEDHDAVAEQVGEMVSKMTGGRLSLARVEISKPVKKLPRKKTEN